MMRAHELTWALALLESVSDVDVLSIRVDTSYLTKPWVECVVIDVHASTVADAGRLVEDLRLREDHDATRLHTYDDGTVKKFRDWRGWSADASQSVPVNVRVTAAESVHSVSHTETPEEVAA